MRQGDIVRLKVSGISSEGSGIARSSECGFVFFIDGAILDEEVTCRIVTIKKNYAICKVLERHCDSSDRTSPVCLHFGKCGGCHLQHMIYPAQLRFKTQTVKDALMRIGGILNPNVADCVPSPQEWGYRNKASLPIQRTCFDNFTVGFYKVRSHDIVPLSACPVLMPELERDVLLLTDEMRNNNFCGYDIKNSGSNFIKHIVMRRTGFTDESLCAVIGNRKISDKEISTLKSIAKKLPPSLKGMSFNLHKSDSNFLWGDTFTDIYGAKSITETLDNFSFKYEISSFFQINPRQTLNLYKYASGLLGDLPSNVLELYAGVGSLTAFLASVSNSVTAVESWLPASKYMKINAQDNGLKNIRFYSSRAEDIINSLTDEAYDAVVLDPPRTGCDASVIDAIVKISPKKIIYVSCNPATLARDVKLLSKGGYVFQNAVPFDMFPQTTHVECVVLMSKMG